MSPEKNRLSPGLLVGVAVAVLAAGAATAWWTINSLKTPPLAPTPSQPSAPAQNPVTQPPQESSVQVYWLDSSGDSLELLPSTVTVQRSEQPQEVLRSAFSQLLEGPKDEEFTSTIPQGTNLLGVSVEQDGVHVNLSQEFTVGGGSASMSGRLGQIIYTATSLNPDAPVWLDVEGEPLEVLGGEGLVIDQPMTRQDFDENFAF